MDNIRIRNTPDELIRKIKILANDKCETVTQLLKPVIREISEKYNEIEFQENEKSELVVSGISDSVIKKLELISKKTGVTVPQLLRLELYHFIENQPSFEKSLF